MSLNSIMLDPSLLISSKNLAATETRLRRVRNAEEEIELFISRSFREYVGSLESKEHLAESALFKFMGKGREPAEIHHINELFSEIDEEHTFGIDERFQNGDEWWEIKPYSTFKEEMWYYNRYEDPNVLFEIMADEFVFLNEHSILSVDTSKVLTRLKDIGMVSIEVGEKVFQEMISRTLNLDEDEEEIINAANVARTFGKYALIGGTSLSSQFTGFLATVLIPTSIGIVLAIDPEGEFDPTTGSKVDSLK